MVVIHYTAMDNVAAARARLCDPAALVSAHYLIARDGAGEQLVKEGQRAWHAGHGEWRGQNDINSRSIGIELDNTGRHPFPEPQMATLESLLKDILARWDIPPSEVIGHADMAPDRKLDPGRRFDWARLARRGLAQPAGTRGVTRRLSPETFRQQAQKSGFTAPSTDADLLNAVRARFRPEGHGPLTTADLAALPDAS